MKRVKTNLRNRMDCDSLDALITRLVTKHCPITRYCLVTRYCIITRYCLVTRYYLVAEIHNTLCISASSQVLPSYHVLPSYQALPYYQVLPSYKVLPYYQVLPSYQVLHSTRSFVDCELLHTVNSVERSDVTGNRFDWQLGEKKSYITPLPPYYIVIVSSVKILTVKAIEFHIIVVGPNPNNGRVTYQRVHL